MLERRDRRIATEVQQVDQQTHEGTPDAQDDGGNKQEEVRTTEDMEKEYDLFGPSDAEDDKAKDMSEDMAADSDDGVDDEPSEKRRRLAAIGASVKQDMRQALRTNVPCINQLCRRKSWTRW